MKRAEALEAFQVLVAGGGAPTVEIRGTSMEPFLRAGDRVHLGPVEPSALRLGDLMAFLQDGNLIIHRFAGRARRDGVVHLRQKGDHLPGCGLVHPEALVGRGLWMERDGRRRDLLRGRGRWACRVRGLGAWATWAARGAVGRVMRRTVPPVEHRILALGAHLEWTPAQVRVAAGLLGEGPRWKLLLEEGARFGVLPLLHRHLAHPALAPSVPGEVRAALEKAYLRTSMKNLRILGLLRRFLLKAREAGVPVILLKGAFLAQGIYGDPGLRPMSDLDLLCRKEDEGRLGALLTGMGAVRSGPGIPEEPLLSPRRWEVEEKLGHGAPWWFPEICRIELHYHLLSRHLPEDGDLLAALWAGAVPHTRDGLEVLALDPEHQVLHLASHLHHHLQEGAFNLTWFVDVREVLRDPGLSRERLRVRALSLGLDRACAAVFRLAGASWAGRGIDDEEALRRLALRMGVRAGRGPALARYGAALGAVSHVKGFRGRAGYVLELFFPPAAVLSRRYGVTQGLRVPFQYPADLLFRIFRLLRGGPDGR